MSDEFSPFAVMQQPAHCGPCSLSSCLFMLGTDVTQRDVAWAAGKPYRVFREGMNERELSRAGRRYGALSGTAMSKTKTDGERFCRAVREHVEQRGPAVLLVLDYQHWISVVGYLPAKRQFVIYDPSDDEPFVRWGHERFIREAWNRSGNPRCPPIYYALLLRRKDGQPPLWRITEDWIRIHNRGSDCTAATIATDLETLVSRAKTNHPTRCTNDTLACVMEECRDSVLDSITTWSEGSGDYSVKDLRELYSDYMVCAEACSFKFPARSDKAAVVAGLTALFSAYWWGGEM
jgi:hypothetical protein